MSRTASGLALAAALLLTALRPASAADVPLAIKGYDPVAYFTDGKPTPGRPEFEYVWNNAGPAGAGLPNT